MSGLPLLSGPVPESTRSDPSSCRRCNKEFNFILARARRCNHCGFQYCHSCTDYHGLMPRAGPETGYDPLPVCAFCIEYLTITAGGRGHLRTLTLAKLKKYIAAYNIKGADRAVEKDDLIDAILAAKGSNGCLTPAHESFYRKYSVPDRSTSQPRRNIFSSSRNAPQPAPPSQPPRPNRTPAYEFPRPDLEPDPPAQPQYAPPRGGRPNTAPPRARAASAAPPAPPRPPSVPPPTLDGLLDMSPDAIRALSVHALKAILFANHVQLGQGALEKGDLVKKVVDLVEEERRTRERRRMEEEAEERERIEQQRVLMEQFERQQREERERVERERATQANANAGDSGAPPPAYAPEEEVSFSTTPGPPTTPPRSAAAERGGLCVICQDEDANIAIVDCGHLAMCRDCSDLVMSSSRECPLCRTRIVTEARLLRIFKT
ncbi:RING-finger domain-containing protein [Mycena kentingensis (nom. inval.)]|nr:RING-finger domain-containing protein [Mycena kentingensis (nom. inval.)]